VFLSTYVKATLVCFGSFARAWVLSPKRYSVSKPTTLPRHDAIFPIGHELMLLAVGCVCLMDKEDIVFFGLKLVGELPNCSTAQPHSTKAFSDSQPHTGVGLGI